MPEREGRGRARCPGLRRARGLALGGFFFVALVVIAPRQARADDAQEFEIGKNRFDAGQYEEAASRFTAMLDERSPPCSKTRSTEGNACRLSDPDLTERARAFNAASLIALNRTSEADAQIERLLRANPAYAPSPATFPPDVLDRFSAVRGRIRQELEAIARRKAEQERQARLAAQRETEAEERRVAELERLASEERVVRPGSRLVALLPFGVGQFQNGAPVLGSVLAIGQVLAGGTSIVLAGLHAQQSSVDVEAVDEQANTTPDREALRAQVETLALANRIAFGAFAALAVGGILEAQISFVPERTRVRKRELPPTLRRGPRVSVGPAGPGLGVSGSF